VNGGDASYSPPGAGQQTSRLWLVSMAQLVDWTTVGLLWAAAGTSTRLAAVAGAGDVWSQTQRRRTAPRALEGELGSAVASASCCRASLSLEEGLQHQRADSAAVAGRQRCTRCAPWTRHSGRSAAREASPSQAQAS
jgi:hypothetical protein